MYICENNTVMTIHGSFNVGGGGNRSPFGFFGPLLILAVFFIALFYLAKGVFRALSWVAPFLLVAILILDYKTIIDYINFVFKLLKENTVMGVIAVLVTFFGYPFVLGFLLLKVLGKRQLNKMGERIKKEHNTYTDYEEVKEEKDDFLELPQIPRREQPKAEPRTNDYDDMFK
jgi:hypothetical protein